MAFEQVHANQRANQQKLADITNFIATDPQIQQWRDEAAARNERFEGPAAKQKIEDYLASKGMQLPEGYVIQQNGTPVKDAGFDWKPIVGMGALVTGGLLGPALLGADPALSSGALTSNFIDPGILAGGSAASTAGTVAGGTAAAAAGGAASDLAPLASGPLLDSAGGEVALNTGALVPGGINPAVSAGSQIADLVNGTQSQVSSLADKAKKGVDAYDKLSKALGTYADTDVNNQRNLDRDRIVAQRERNTNETDALRKLVTTNYLQNQKSGYVPPTIGTVNGTQIRLPDMGAGFMAPSAAQRQGASTLEPELLKRLAPGGSVWPSDPSTASKIANTGSLIASGAGALTEADPDWMSQAGHFIKNIFT